MPSVHRIGRKPYAWQYPDWSRANPDGTFGNRFDDPNGAYRVLYASSARLGCFLETLARYRPDLALYAELEEIEGDDDFVPAGVVPREWFEVRVMAAADARTCAGLCHAAGGELEQTQFLLGHVSVETTERYLGCKQRLRSAVNDRFPLFRDIVLGHEVVR